MATWFALRDALFPAADGDALKEIGVFGDDFLEGRNFLLEYERGSLEGSAWFGGYGIAAEGGGGVQDGFYPRRGPDHQAGGKPF